MQIGIVKQGQSGQIVNVCLITCDIDHVDNLWKTTRANF